MQLKSQIGILGGGQLSMMLAQQAQRLGLRPAHLTPHVADPACRVSSNFQIGDPKQSADLQTFIKGLDVLTFESEFYDAQFLKKELQNFKGQIFPSLDVLQLLQDRKTQKHSFEQNKLETSSFIHTRTANDVENFFVQHKGLVAKQRWNGYDGYGTFVLRTQKDLKKFLEKHQSNLDSFIFEKLINFQYEVAIQVARSRKGHTVFFPWVQTIQKDNKCFIVEGPEKDSAGLKKLEKNIQKFLSQINYVGVIGFEFFKTSKTLILNEVAPRVHNTGHHTLDSCDIDQFTMHWLCVLQDKLPVPQLKTKSFVMLNLIGLGKKEVQVPDRGSGSVFWYGKSNRKGRKLGHINYVGESKKALKIRALSDLKFWKL